MLLLKQNAEYHYYKSKSISPTTDPAEIQCIITNEALHIVQYEMILRLKKCNKRIKEHTSRKLRLDRLTPDTDDFRAYHEYRRLALNKISELQDSTAILLDIYSLLNRSEENDDTIYSIEATANFQPKGIEALSIVLSNTNNDSNSHELRSLVLENYSLTEHCCSKILKYKLDQCNRKPYYEFSDQLFQKDKNAQLNAKTQLESSIEESSENDIVSKIKSMNSALQQRIRDIEGISNHQETFDDSRMSKYHETYDIDLISYTISNEVQNRIPTSLIKMENKALSKKAQSMMLYCRLKCLMRWYEYKGYYSLSRDSPERALPPRWN